MAKAVGGQPNKEKRAGSSSGLVKAESSHICLLVFQEKLEVQARIPSSHFLERTNAGARAKLGCA